MTNENAGRLKLEAAWRHFHIDQQAECVRDGIERGRPSYVRLLTCLEESDYSHVNVIRRTPRREPNLTD